MFLVAVIACAIAACGSDKPTEEIVKLESEKDRLSYAVGAMQGKEFANSGDPSFAKLDFEAIATAFDANLKEVDATDCQNKLRAMFSPTGEMDTTKLKEASDCFGLLAGSSFYKEMKEIGALDQFDLKKVSAGFRHGLFKKDTLLSEADQMQLVQAFVQDITMKQQQEMAKLDAPFLSSAKAKPNTKEIDGGIIIETIQEGKGGSPSMTDDVEAHYILTNAKGDTIESSLASGKPLARNLQGLIAGWSMSFPQMKKGGKYRLYIPSNLAYQQGALCFYIEFLNFGPEGTLSPKMEMPQF